MTTWQIARQLAYRLRLVTFADGGLALNAVRVVAGLPPEALDAGLKLPFALVQPGDATPDPERPDLQDQALDVTLVVGIAGDEVGERALLGANPTTGAGGRGLLELEERVHAVLVGPAALPSLGFVLRLVEVGAAAAQKVEGKGFVAALTLRFQARATATRDYPAPRKLTATAAGGGAVNLAWTSPPARFDRHAAHAGVPLLTTAVGNLVLRRAAGATVPASVTAGTGVTVGAFATALTDTPGAGQWSYALFAGFDEDGDGDSDAYSAAATRTVTAT